MEEISHLHIWSIDGEKNVMSAHVKVRNGLEARDEEKIKETIRSQLSSCNLTHSTIEINHS